MISYTDLEFAISRWKARAAGVPQAPADPVASGAVAAEMPVSTAPEDASVQVELGSSDIPEG